MRRGEAAPCATPVSIAGKLDRLCEALGSAAGKPDCARHPGLAGKPDCARHTGLAGKLDRTTLALQRPEALLATMGASPPPHPTRGSVSWVSETRIPPGRRGRPSRGWGRLFRPPRGSISYFYDENEMQNCRECF